MIDHIERRALSLLLALVMVLSVLPVQALAKELFSTTVLDGKVSVTGGGTSGLGTGENTADTITVTASAEKNNCSGEFTAKAHTITIANATTDETLTLSFDYAADTFSAFTVAGEDKASAPKGSWGGELAPGANVTIVLTSNASQAVANLVLSNFKLQDDSPKNVTVLPGTNGTVKVNGTAITANTSVSTTFTEGVTVSATANSGYVFLGWLDSNYNVLSTAPTALIQPEEDMTIGAYFAAKDTQGYWMAGNKIHTDLNAAVTAAQADDGLVVLLKDATLPAGTYTIPAGVTLLIPHDDALTVYGANPEVIVSNDSGWKAPTAFRTLTMSNGAKLVINGNLELAAKHFCSAGGNTIGGAVSGKYGCINMQSGSVIDVNGTLYAWGYIKGAGRVNANSGATVYEKMQVADYRGGSATTSITGFLNKDKKFFPFSQYYVQNVEVEEYIYAGATLMAHAAIYASSPETAAVAFVGTDSAMFGLGSGSYAVKRYNGAEDRLEIDVYGNASLNSITLEAMGSSINSSSFRLGINNNITIHIHNGVTTISQDMVLQPGVKVIVDREAALFNTAQVFVLDAEDWGPYCRGQNIIPVQWSTVNGATEVRTAANVTDAVVDINGTILNGGQLHSSGSESIISSEGTGVYLLNTSANTSATVYQAKGTDSASLSWDKISMTAAVLVHGDGTTLTAEGNQYDVFIYDSLLDKWVKKNIYNSGAGYNTTLTYDANGGEGAVAEQTVEYLTIAGAFAQTGVMAPYSFALDDGNLLKREGYEFTGWNTQPDGSGKSFAALDYVTISADSTLYAQWHDPEHIVTYVANAPEGVEVTGTMKPTELTTDEEGKSELEVPNCVFTVAGWEFDGWNTKPDGSGDAYTVGEVYTVTGDLTLYAQWSAPRYVIEFDHNAPTGTAVTGAMPDQEAAKGEKLNANMFAVEGYEFTGWNTKADGKGIAYADGATVPAEATTLFAQWAKKTYAITWVIDGKSETTTVEHGQVPTFNGSTDKAQVGCTTYTFAGWNTTPVAATGPATYIARYTEGENHDWSITTYTNITATHHTVSHICKNDANHIKNDEPVEHTYVNGVCVCKATKSYTIKWDTDGDGNVDKTTTAAHGTVPTAPDANKADTAEWDYTFTGWKDEDGNGIVAATDDVTYTAVFTAVKQTYTISWDTDGDGDVDTTTTVAYGDIPAYEGTPSKAATAEYSYTFTGWTPAVTAVTGNAEYTAQFTFKANSYTITFGNTGDSVMENKTVAYGDTIGTIDDPVKEGYNFTGWTVTDAEGSTVDVSDGKMPAKNLTYTAGWQIKSYTITWKVEGQDDVTTAVNHGETPAYEGTPAKESTAQYTYTFAGWTPKIVAATGEVTYTAKFTPVLRSYDITFVVDGQENKVVSTQYGQTPVYDAEGKVPEKTADAYYSYEFAGWDPELAPVSGEATYTATWTKTPVEYTITFVIDGVEDTFYQVKGGYGTNVTYNVPSTDKTGYTFNGWDKELPATFPAENVTITGSYTVNQYTITFKGDFNTEKDDAFVDYNITKNYGEAITAEDIAALNATLPTITGWELQGWYYAEEYEYEEADEPVWKYTDEYQIPATMGADNVTVYAKWDAIVYQLTVKSSIDNEVMTYGYMRYEESYETLEEFNTANGFFYDDSCIEEDCPSLLPEGYTFAGYKYEDGTEMTFPIECWPAEEVTIIAQFVPIDYTITFMSEGVEVGKITAPYGSDITAQVAAITATKEGYKFNCWMNEAGKCVTFTTMPLNGMTVTADFTVNEYLVNFFASKDDTTAYDSITVEYGADLNVEELLAQVTDPSKTGYTWIGWNTTNVPATMPAEAVNIYGTWNVNSYNVVWTIDGETYDTTTVAYGETITEPTEPTKEGHTFSGWSEYPDTMPAEDVTVTGSWTVNSYTITFDTDGGNETIGSITADYGAAITWPEAPTKTGHTFRGWDSNGDGQADALPNAMPEGGLNLKAVWAKNTVYIKWIIDGKETTQDYKYGDAITAPVAEKASNAKWTYKFTGWDAEVPATATADATYTAQFEQDEAVKYTVKFVNGENTVYETQIAWNVQVTLDGFTAPTMEGNTLTWTMDGEEVTFPYAMTTKEVTFVANWTPITYTITADGEVKEFTYGTAVSIADPTKEGHTFAGWLKDGVAYELPETMPAENIVITSDWTVNTYTLTVSTHDAEGKFITETKVVPYGAKLSDYYLETPSYTDSNGWFNEFDYWSVWTWSNNDDATMVEYDGDTMPASDVKMYSIYVFTGWLDYMDGVTGYAVKSDPAYYRDEWATIDGAQYYFVLVEDWFEGESYSYSCIVKDITLIDGNYYAFDHESGKWLNTYTGIYEAVNGDLYYVENGIAVKNKGMVQVDDPAVENGHLYYYFGCADAKCNEVGCAGEYKAQRGIGHWTEITNGYLVLWGYEFNQDGTIVHDEDTSKNGVHLDEGVKYYYIDGVKVHKGLFIGEDGEYYYARSNGSLVVGRDYWISGSHLNGVVRNGAPVEEGTYTFDSEGRIVWPTTVKNGVYAENGSLYFYKDGARSYEGLIKYTGSLTRENGSVEANAYADDIIYVRGTGELAVNRSYWPTKNNGVMPSATYNFDEYGRMIRTNGFVTEDDGVYYYVNGNRYHAGLIKVDDAYYYVKSSGQMVAGCRYWITHTNGYDVEEGSYEFAADGKMIIPEPEAVKNGIVEENGKLYYYLDGKLNYAGLIVYTGSLTTEDGTVIDNAYEDAWIYVRGTGELVVGRSYWVTKHNDLLEKSATYQFDENGVMQNAPI